MGKCDDLKTRMNAFNQQLDEARTNELGHELKTAGAAATAVVGAGLVVCALAEPCGLLAAGSAGAIAAGGAVLGGGTAAIGAGIHEEQAENRREKLKQKYDRARAAYCACIRKESDDTGSGSDTSSSTDTTPTPTDATPVPTDSTIPDTSDVPDAPPQANMDEQESRENDAEQCAEYHDAAELCVEPDILDQYDPGQGTQDDEEMSLISGGDEGMSYAE